MKVAIIDKGEWGWVSRRAGEYKLWEEAITALLEDNGHEVKVFPEISLAQEWLGGTGSMVFTTRGMLDTADELAQQQPSIRYVVLSALPPLDYSGSVHLLDKGDLPNGKKSLGVILGR